MSTETGRRAEAIAAAYLRHQGYKILEQNWRTRRCEIDIIAARKDIVYFVEVKYRRSSAQGGGLDYITARKLAQMRFAAECWLARQHAYSDYRLAAIELSGESYGVTAWLDELL